MAEKISIAIPYHDTPHTAFFLSRLLTSIHQQKYLDYEIILTRGHQMARNHNTAIARAKGDIIQMMQMDDYFAHSDALKNIADSFKENAWSITACLHDKDGKVGWPHQPEWTDDIWTGNNRLGSISTLSMRREGALLFEEPLQWLVDVDLYYRLYLKYGLPTLIKTENVIVDVRTDRLTHTIPSQLKQEEVEYLRKKYSHYVNRNYPQ